MSRKKILIIGGGPAGLMAAFQLKDLADITIIDHKKAVGRKFLVAGDGGFNLTHSEPLESFLKKYDSDFVRNCVQKFTPDDTRNWLWDLGIETYIGSSGKIFPVEGIKPIEVLNAIVKSLKKSGVKFLTETKLTDFSDQQINVSSAGKQSEIQFDYLIFALGGASWKKTGSTGEWLELFAQKGISVLPFQSSNSGIELQNLDLLKEFEGSQIKNIRLYFGEQSVAGDLTITSYGLEGKPAYASNNWLRKNDFSGLKIDFKPQLSEIELLEKLTSATNVRKSFKAAKIPDSVYNWLKSELSKEEFTDVTLLAKKLKAFEPKIKGLRPIDEVISVVGGVDLNIVDENGKLKNFEKIWCCGEMLNWDAPTGGYLLQACFSTAFAVSENLKFKIEKMV